MRKTALVAVLLAVVAACSPSTTGATSTTDGVTTTIDQTTTTTPATTTLPVPEFPVTIEAHNGSVTVESRPESIVSLSPTGTEMLFEIGAGPQVVAVDSFSYYPDDAPVTDLSSFEPNLEAILAYEPDLVVASYDPGNTLADGLDLVDVPFILFDGLVTDSIDDVYAQIEALGAATGNLETAVKVNEQIQGDLEEIAAGVDRTGEDVTYFHEIDPTPWTVTSNSLIGEIYGLFGMANIADESADGQTSFAISSEFVVAADPDIIFLADADYGESAETVAARPGWSGMTAVTSGAVVPVNADISSRWGPRIVDFARVIAEALAEHG